MEKRSIAHIKDGLPPKSMFIKGSRKVSYEFSLFEQRLVFFKQPKL